MMAKQFEKLALTHQSFIAEQKLFFVATASFVKETGIDVNRPSAQTASPQKKANIMVTVTKTGEVWVDRRKVDIRAVRPNVERLLVENPDSTVIVVADAETPARLIDIDQGGGRGPQRRHRRSDARGGEGMS